MGQGWFPRVLSWKPRLPRPIQFVSKSSKSDLVSLKLSTCLSPWQRTQIHRKYVSHGDCSSKTTNRCCLLVRPNRTNYRQIIADYQLFMRSTPQVLFRAPKTNAPLIPFRDNTLSTRRWSPNVLGEPRDASTLLRHGRLAPPKTCLSRRRRRRRRRIGSITFLANF